MVTFVDRFEMGRISCMLELKDPHFMQGFCQMTGTCSLLKELTLQKVDGMFPTPKNVVGSL